MSEQRGIKVVITEPLACGHSCNVIYSMEEYYTLTLKTGPITSINPTHVLPDLSWQLPSLDKMLELSGKYGDVQFIGIIVSNRRFVCAECGAVLFAIYPPDEEDKP
jgi:hypothetical protein